MWCVLLLQCARELVHMLLLCVWSRSSIQGGLRDPPLSSLDFSLLAVDGDGRPEVPARCWDAGRSYAAPAEDSTSGSGPPSKSTFTRVCCEMHEQIRREAEREPKGLEGGKEGE